MAHKKAGGSTHLGRDSNPQYLGVKAYDGQFVKSGAVIVRQRGTAIHPGINVRVGRDDTLFTTITGIVKFTQKKRRRFDRSLKLAKFANVLPSIKVKVVKPKAAKKTTAKAKTARAKKPKTK